MIKYVFHYNNDHYYMFVETKEYDNFFKYAIVESFKIKKEYFKITQRKCTFDYKYYAIDVISGQKIIGDDNLEKLNKRIYNDYRELIINLRNNAYKMKKLIEIRDKAISIYEECNKEMTQELNDELEDFMNMDLLNLKLERDE